MSHRAILEKATGRNLIYKYASSCTDFLKDELYRFTQPNELNDPFEVKPRILMNEFSPEDYEWAQKEAESQGFPKGLPKEDLEIFLRPFPGGHFDEKSFPTLWPAHVPDLRDEPFHCLEELDRFKAEKSLREFNDAVNQVGIFCLTEEPHSLIMWAHYADGHKGMLLGFDRDHAFFKRGDGLHPVDYLEKRVSVSSVGGQLRICGLRFDKTAMPLPIEAFLRKHCDWEYEQELRMFFPLNACNRHHNDIYFFRIPAEALRAIVLGAQVSGSIADTVKRAVLRDPRWKHIKLFFAKLDEKEMALNYLEEVVA